MKNENGKYIDENNNSWDCSIYSKERAIELSKTLINCSDCRNCRNCSDCSDCRNCRNCSDCSDCIGCSDCSDCSDCIGCSDCSDFKENPNRYTGNKMGSRNAQTTVYWVVDNIQVVCGCFRGNLQDLENAVREKHSEKHLEDYLKFIKIVKRIMEIENEKDK